MGAFILYFCTSPERLSSHSVQYPFLGEVYARYQLVLCETRIGVIESCLRKGFSYTLAQIIQVSYLVISAGFPATSFFEILSGPLGYIGFLEDVFKKYVSEKKKNLIQYQVQEILFLSVLP